MKLGLAALVLLGVFGLMAYVRLAPLAPERWHLAVPEVVSGGVSGGVVRFVPSDAPEVVLGRLVAVAAAAPRTVLAAGSVAEGRITWVARSRVWGFPDYITAEVVPGGVRIWSRQRYGLQDMGVNTIRMDDWLARIGAN